MTNKEPYRLCGGTFFVLVSNARKPMPGKDELYKGTVSGLSEPEALLSLAKTLIPDIPRPLQTEMNSLKDDTRDFKACIGNGGRFFRFGGITVLKTFDDRARNYNEFCPKRGGSERIYTKTLGENSIRDVRPTYCDSPALDDLNWREEPDRATEAAS